MIRRILLIILLFFPLAYAGEQITSYDDSTLPVLNEKLRQISDGMNRPKSLTSAWFTGTLPRSKGGLGSTVANNIANGPVVLDNSTKIPALDGSLITNIPSYADARFKVGSVSVDTQDADGIVTVTGIGFTPKLVVFNAVHIDTVPNPDINYILSGRMDSTSQNCETYSEDALGVPSSVVGSKTDMCLWTRTHDANIGGATFHSFDADGFTINWIVENDFTGTLELHYIAYR